MNNYTNNSQQLLKKITQPSKDTLYSLVNCVLIFICLYLAVLSSHTTIPEIISPLSASITAFKPFQSHKDSPNTFSFVPGSAPNKYDDVEFHGLNLLLFYDAPVNVDGSLNTETRGFEMLHSPDAQTLFQTAHEKGTKVQLTVTLTYNNDILAFLDNGQAQQELYKQTAQEIVNAGIDGVAIDFELHGPVNTDYQTKFTTFVKGYTDHIHAAVPNSLVSIVLSDTIDEYSLYDTKVLSEVTDKTLIMAYNFAVPESENAKIISPVFGVNNDDYKETLTSTQQVFSDAVSAHKLVMERAWYGSGNNYPLYKTENVLASNKNVSENTLSTPLSVHTVDRLIKDLPADAQAAARTNLPYIAEALEDEGILNANVLAYALATIQHETANTFEPIDEYKGRKSARRLGYEGGTNYYGRGFIQLTHLRNYQHMGRRINMGEELVKHPELASQPIVAAKVLAAYFKDFGISKLATQGNFIDARTLINPDQNGIMIAQEALSFLYALV